MWHYKIIKLLGFCVNSGTGNCVVFRETHQNKQQIISAQETTAVPGFGIHLENYSLSFFSPQNDLVKEH